MLFCEWATCVWWEVCVLGMEWEGLWNIAGELFFTFTGMWNGLSWTSFRRLLCIPWICIGSWIPECPVLWRAQNFCSRRKAFHGSCFPALQTDLILSSSAHHVFCFCKTVDTTLVEVESMKCLETTRKEICGTDTSSGVLYSREAVVWSAS